MRFRSAAFILVRVRLAVLWWPVCLHPSALHTFSHLVLLGLCSPWLLNPPPCPPSQAYPADPSGYTFLKNSLWHSEFRLIAPPVSSITILRFFLPQGITLYQDLSAASYVVQKDPVRINCLIVMFTPAGARWILCAQSLSHVRLFATPWPVAHQAPLSMEFSRHEYLSELPFPLPEDLPSPGVEPVSPVAPALAGGFCYHWAIWESFQ